MSGNDLILLVTGGRDFIDADYVRERLDYYHITLGGFGVVIHGAARGVDTIADGWAMSNGVQPARCPALWDHYRRLGQERRAGPIRNGAMLLLSPDVVIAFPGADGTANMVAQVNDANVCGAGIRLIELAEDYRALRVTR